MGIDKYWIGGKAGLQGDFEQDENWETAAGGATVIPVSTDTIHFTNRAGIADTVGTDGYQIIGKHWSVTKTPNQGAKAFDGMNVSENFEGRIGRVMQVGGYAGDKIIKVGETSTVTVPVHNQGFPNLLVNGDTIIMAGTQGYDGRFQVHDVASYTCQIDTAYAVPPEENVASGTATATVPLRLTLNAGKQITVRNNESTYLECGDGTGDKGIPAVMFDSDSGFLSLSTHPDNVAGEIFTDVLVMGNGNLTLQSNTRCDTLKVFGASPTVSIDTGCQDGSGDGIDLTAHGGATYSNSKVGSVEVVSPGSVTVGKTDLDPATTLDIEQLTGTGGTFRWRAGGTLKQFTIYNLTLEVVGDGAKTLGNSLPLTMYGGTFDASGQQGSLVFNTGDKIDYKAGTIKPPYGVLAGWA